MKIAERKLLIEFCKESVIAQELLDTQLVLAQIHFDLKEYLVLIYVK